RPGGGLRAPVLVEAPGQEHRTPRGMVVAAHGGLPVLGVVVLRVTLGLARLPALADGGGQQLVHLGVLRPDQRGSGTGGWRAPSDASSERTGAHSGQQCPSADRVAPYCPFGCHVDSLGLATVRRCSRWTCTPAGDVVLRRSQPPTATATRTRPSTAPRALAHDRSATDHSV